MGKGPFLEIGYNLKNKKLVMQKFQESLLDKKINNTKTDLHGWKQL